MKRILCLTAVIFLNLIGHASDQTFYGAWWTTWTASKGVAKDAGEFLAVINDVGNVAGIGTVTIKATANDGEQSGTVSIYTFHGTWTQTANPNIIKVTVAKVLDGDTEWKGTLNVVKGALIGTYRAGRLYSGKFQAARNKSE